VAITADELARVRYWVPASWTPTAVFDDAAVGVVWTREADTEVTASTEAAESQSLANVYRVAYVLTQRMISGLVQEPDSFSVGGEYSESHGAAINLLMNRLSELTRLRDAAVAASTGNDKVLVTQIVRPNYYGR
jgi:hypothetical protein